MRCVLLLGLMVCMTLSVGCEKTIKEVQAPVSPELAIQSWRWAARHSAAAARPAPTAIMPVRIGRSAACV